MKALFTLSLVIFLSACSHTLRFRASHFAVPVTGEDQWSGHVALVGAAETRVTVINNMVSSPPERSVVKINDDNDIDVSDFFWLERGGLRR